MTKEEIVYYCDKREAERDAYYDIMTAHELAFSRGLKRGRFDYDEDGYRVNKKSRHRAKARRIAL